MEKFGEDILYHGTNVKFKKWKVGHQAHNKGYKAHSALFFTTDKEYAKGKEENKNKRISPIFILPEYRNKGIAQSAIKICEEIHGNNNWELSTILQEKGNCYLYEKLGYHSTGKTQVINDRLTLIFYKK